MAILKFNSQNEPATQPLPKAQRALHSTHQTFFEFQLGLSTLTSFFGFD
jgi:hypothetical protein